MLTDYLADEIWPVLSHGIAGVGPCAIVEIREEVRSKVHRRWKVSQKCFTDTGIRIDSGS